MWVRKKWWAVAESNCGHEAFQASALPTELTAHELNFTLLRFQVSRSAEEQWNNTAKKQKRLHKKQKLGSKFLFPHAIVQPPGHIFERL
jgi:hypothetical protein